MFGIVLIDDLPFCLECHVQVKPGRGDIIILGQIEPAIEETINNAIRWANLIHSLEDDSKDFPNLGDRSLRISLGVRDYPTPILGPSYGLLLGLAIVLALLGRRQTLHPYVTGGVDEDGVVQNVGGISQKRKGVKQLGGSHLILPAAQTDFFSGDVVQIPVRTIFDAYTAVTYGKAERS